jgi:Ca2+-binding RTX toxin-like protein
MNNHILAPGGARFTGTLAVVLAATLAALLAVFVLAKPSGAQETIVTVEPTEVGFGAVEVSANPETRTISIKNTGAITLVIGGVDISGTNADDFDVVTNIDPLNGLSVGAGDTVTLEVSFDPATEGAKEASLVLNNLLGQAIPGAPQINISGTGVTVQPDAPAECTIVGTDNGETLTGTPAQDVICALGGNDRANGLGDNDKIRGGLGKDRLFDNAGQDQLLGEGNKDRLNAKDGEGGDVLSGGPGRDRIKKDKGDQGKKR